MIDTATSHDRQDEKIVGQALGSHRDDVILATKARLHRRPGEQRDLSRHHRPTVGQPARLAPTTSTSTSSTVDGQHARGDVGALGTSSRAARCATSVSNFAGWQHEGARHRARGGVAGLRQPTGAPVAAGAFGRVRDPGARSGSAWSCWEFVAGGLLLGNYRLTRAPRAAGTDRLGRPASLRQGQASAPSMRSSRSLRARCVRGSGRMALAGRGRSHGAHHRRGPRRSSCADDLAALAAGSARRSNSA